MLLLGHRTFASKHIIIIVEIPRAEVDDLRYYLASGASNDHLGASTFPLIWESYPLRIPVNPINIRIGRGLIVASATKLGRCNARAHFFLDLGHITVHQ